FTRHLQGYAGYSFFSSGGVFEKNRRGKKNNFFFPGLQYTFCNRRKSVMSNTTRDIVALATVLLILLFLLIHTANAGAQNQARADIKNAEGKSVGTASLRETKDGVVITVNVKGLPQGLHAVHVHTVGKCDAPAFT